MLAIDKDGKAYNREFTDKDFHRIVKTKELTLDDKQLISGIDTNLKCSLLDSRISKSKVSEYLLKDIQHDFNHLLLSVEKMFNIFDSLPKEKNKELLEFLLIEYFRK